MPPLTSSLANLKKTLIIERLLSPLPTFVVDVAQTTSKEAPPERSLNSFFLSLLLNEAISNRPFAEVVALAIP